MADDEKLRATQCVVSEIVKRTIKKKNKKKKLERSLFACAFLASLCLSRSLAVADVRHAVVCVCGCEKCHCDGGSASTLLVLVHSYVYTFHFAVDSYEFSSVRRRFCIGVRQCATNSLFVCCPSERLRIGRTV